MWQRFIRWFQGLFGQRELSALEAMDAIQRDKGPRANPADWAKLRGNYLSRVFSEADRKRLWRRHRRRFEQAGPEWEPSQPTSADVACLSDLLRDLAR